MLLIFCFVLVTVFLLVTGLGVIVDHGLLFLLVTLSLVLLMIMLLLVSLVTYTGLLLVLQVIGLLFFFWLQVRPDVVMLEAQVGGETHLCLRHAGSGNHSSGWSPIFM